MASSTQWTWIWVNSGSWQCTERPTRSVRRDWATQPSWTDVGWPREGTLDLLTVQAVHQVVTGTPGHSDKFPYIDSLLLTTPALPPRFFTNGQGQHRAFMAQPLRKNEQKAALLAAALRSLDPVKQTVPCGKGKLREHHYATTSAPTAKSLDTGGMSAPIAGGHLKCQRSSVNPTKKGTSLSWLSKSLSAWLEQYQTREEWASWSWASGSPRSPWK